MKEDEGKKMDNARKEEKKNFKYSGEMCSRIY